MQSDEGRDGGVGSAMPGKAWEGQREVGSSTPPPRHWSTKASAASVSGRTVRSRSSWRQAAPPPEGACAGGMEDADLSRPTVVGFPFLPVFPPLGRPFDFGG